MSSIYAKSFKILAEVKLLYFQIRIRFFFCLALDVVLKKVLKLNSEKLGSDSGLAMYQLCGVR